jgi:hypothetical protein
MKKYTVRYQIMSYWYESEIFTTSTHAALTWAANMGSNATVVKEEVE